MRLVRQWSNGKLPFESDSNPEPTVAIQKAIVIALAIPKPSPATVKGKQWSETDLDLIARHHGVLLPRFHDSESPRLKLRLRILVLSQH